MHPVLCPQLRLRGQINGIFFVLSSHQFCDVLSDSKSLSSLSLASPAIRFRHHINTNYFHKSAINFLLFSKNSLMLVFSFLTWQNPIDCVWGLDGWKALFISTPFPGNDKILLWNTGECQGGAGGGQTLIYWSKTREQPARSQEQEPFSTTANLNPISTEPFFVHRYLESDPIFCRNLFKLWISRISRDSRFSVLK